MDDHALGESPPTCPDGGAGDEGDTDDAHSSEEVTDTEDHRPSDEGRTGGEDGEPTSSDDDDPLPVDDDPHPADDDPHPADDDSLSVDEVFGVLSDPARRDVLTYVSSADVDVVPIADLVDELVARETVRRGSRPDRDDVTVTLFHVHLPKLASLGVLAYDERNRTVRYHEDARLERWLAAVRDERPAGDGSDDGA